LSIEPAPLQKREIAAPSRNRQADKAGKVCKFGMFEKTGREYSQQRETAASVAT
jgi:hypothetical protein